MPAFRQVPGGLVCGGFTDHHVHLQLVDAAALATSVLGTVVDLGGNPAVLADLAGRAPAAQARPRIDIEFAGAFLTAPGGYPSDRAWAPAGSVREIPDADAAASAVSEMRAAGASVIKVVAHSTAGPVLSDALFATVVDIAASYGLPVVAHAEGAGEAQRAARLGARMLAHAPFSESLTESEIAQQAASVEWISTLAIHDGDTYRIAVDNVRRFHAAGGVVRYGTDMGNGPTPVGLNPREIAALREAGLDDAALLRALAPQDPADPASRLLLLPGATAESADPLLARPLAPEDLEALR
ncbi:hydrolase [Microbacterium sp. CIAB417]|uniref:hydrolase n=1 Tax=Microbacterium sp. CIAB417 TaxID=2860287 RepID=UPI001FAC6927|nr:hydrolase [Microbacterium sp. CIAB417]